MKLDSTESQNEVLNSTTKLNWKMRVFSVLCRVGLLTLALVVVSFPALAQIVPIVLESEPAAHAAYATEPQLISYRFILDTLPVDNEITRRGEGGSFGADAVLVSADDPARIFSFNEVDYINRGDMAPYGRWYVIGDIVSKRLPAGNYFIRVRAHYSFGQDPMQEWTYDVPIQLIGSPPGPVPNSAFIMQLIAPPAQPLRRFMFGTQNQFNVNVQLQPTLPGPMVMSFGSQTQLVQLENPALELMPDQVRFEQDWVGGFNNVQGILHIGETLPVGHYQLNVTLVWRENQGGWENPNLFEYQQTIPITFEIFSDEDPVDPQQPNGIVSVFRVLPRQPVIAGAPFSVLLVIDPRSVAPTGLVLTDLLPPELEYVAIPAPPVVPESTQNRTMVWLLRNASGIPATIVPYTVRVRDTIAPGTVINLSGQFEILNSNQPITGDQNITVAGVDLTCPVPNQILLAHIDSWGRFVRDERRATEPLIDDLTLLQIIDRWRNCLRGGPN